MTAERTAGCLAKLDRMNKALHHQEPDRVPVSDFFWGSFLKRWRQDLRLPADTDIFAYYDLDWLFTTPNLDPHIKQFKVLKQTDKEIVVRTGFEAVLRKKFADPMPQHVSFETDTIEKAEAFEFDDPWDDRRFFSAGDNQLAGVGDSFVRNLPPWIETVKKLRCDLPVYSCHCEANEYMTRLIGQENTLIWIGLYPVRSDTIETSRYRLSPMLVRDQAQVLPVCRSPVAAGVIHSAWLCSGFTH